MGAEFEGSTRVLDRRICVAPMMDYIDKAAFRCEPKYVLQAVDGLSPLCRLGLLSAPALRAGLEPN
jgi:hypothetical protein